MLCTGDGCEKRKDCKRYYINHREDGEVHTLESLYSFGSGSLRSDGTTEEHWVCGPYGDWGMFLAVEKTNADKIRAMSDEELAAWIAGFVDNTIKGNGLCECEMSSDFVLDFTLWLKQPYKEKT